ncbi:hypothetical protein AWENTII_004291 [Aspergillus wentii]
MAIALGISSPFTKHPKMKTIPIFRPNSKVSVEIPEQPLGIRQLYCSKETPEVDIVAVHGLNGHAINTWTTDGDKTCWLNHPDFLPKYVKRCRVLSWGYNANISNLTGQSTSSDRVLQHATTLVHQLQADRELEDATHRPIIFICHSLGGIIVKRALAYAESRSTVKLNHIHSIYTCTFGILFFGTPHHGSSKARLLRSLQKLVSISTPKRAIDVESGLVKALEQESEILQNITDQFTPLMSNFHIAFFWEQEKTDLKYTRDYIVEETSAAPILDNTERCGIAADHRGMCKFNDPYSQGFRTAVARLRHYSQLAPEVIRDRLQVRAVSLQEQKQRGALEMMRGIPHLTIRENGLHDLMVIQDLSSMAYQSL